MGRVTLAEEMKKVLDFLTINGYVNFGILERVPKHFNLDYWKVGLISFWNLNVPYYCYFIDFSCSVKCSFIKKACLEILHFLFFYERISCYYAKTRNKGVAF